MPGTWDCDVITTDVRLEIGSIHVTFAERSSVKESVFIIRCMAVGQPAINVSGSTPEEDQKHMEGRHKLR